MKIEMLEKIVNKKKIITQVAVFQTANKREWLAIVSAASSIFNKFISLLAIFLYVRWTLPYLGEKLFGVWMTMTTIITFISIFSDLGLGNSLVNHIAASHAIKANARLKEITSSSFFFLVLVSVLGAVIFYFSNTLIQQSLSNGLQSVDELSEVKNALYCLFAIFLINLPFITVDRTLEGLQLTFISSLWAATGNVISLLATYLVTQQEWGLPWLVFSTLGIQSLFRIFYFNIEFNGRLLLYRPAMQAVNFRRVVNLLKTGLVFFLLNFFNVIAFQTDNILISKVLGVDKVTLYSLMQKLMSVSMFFWFYTVSLWPAFAEAHSKNDKKWIQKTTMFVLRLNTCIGLGYGLFLLFFSETVIAAWSNGLTASPSFALIFGFVLYILLNGMMGAASLFFNTGPLLKKHIVGFCVASLATILLKVFFIQQLGVDYLMYMSLLPFLLIYLLPCYLKFRKYIRE